MKGFAFAWVAAALSLTACHRNTRSESAADKVEDTADKAGDKAHDAAETAGDKIEDATDGK